MFEKIKEFIDNILTARDNKTYSVSKIIAISGFSVVAFNFIKSGSVDFQGFCIGVATIMGALAAKYYVEDKDPK